MSNEDVRTRRTVFEAREQTRGRGTTDARMYCPRDRRASRSTQVVGPGGGLIGTPSCGAATARGRVSERVMAVPSQPRACGRRVTGPHALRGPDMYRVSSFNDVPAGKAFRGGRAR